MAKLNKLQRRHYLKIAEDHVKVHALLGYMFTGPEHNDYYDVSDWFTAALRIMTAEQRLQLITEYREQLEHFEISPKSFGL